MKQKQQEAIYTLVDIIYKEFKITFYDNKIKNFKFSYGRIEHNNLEQLDEIPVIPTGAIAHIPFLSLRYWKARKAIKKLNKNSSPITIKTRTMRDGYWFSTLIDCNFWDVMTIPYIHQAYEDGVKDAINLLEGFEDYPQSYEYLKNNFEKILVEEIKKCYTEMLTECEQSLTLFNPGTKKYKSLTQDKTTIQEILKQAEDRLQTISPQLEKL